MEKYDVLKIKKSKLFGQVKLSGAKNSILRLLAASIMTTERIVINNFPKGQLDVKLHVEMLRALGKECLIQNDNLFISQNQKLLTNLDWNKRSIRNTLLILGALLTRYGKGRVPLPGGCEIGKNDGIRKYDLHVMVMKQFGATVWEEGNYLCAEFEKNRNENVKVDLPIRSTGATENSIIIACLSHGTTEIWNPHIRPEIIDLINFLNSMGAHIKVFGQEHIEIKGVASLNGTIHSVIPDNVEALTWLVGGAITGGEIEIFDFPYSHLEVPLIFLKDSGVKIYENSNSLIVKGSKCYPMEISTGPYPGINSDMQPLLAIYSSMAQGESRFVDLRFPGRYGYVYELEKLGVKTEIVGNLLKIYGGNKLVGSSVRALDLRAGAALALAGFTAEGETIINDAWQISRGYDKFLEKISNLEGHAEWIL